MMLGAFGFAIGLGASLGGEVAAAFTTVESSTDGTPVLFEQGMQAYVSTYALLGALGIATAMVVVALSPVLHRRLHMPGRLQTQTARHHESRADPNKLE